MAGVERVSVGLEVVKKFQLGGGIHVFITPPTYLGYPNRALQPNVNPNSCGKADSVRNLYDGMDTRTARRKGMKGSLRPFNFGNCLRCSIRSRCD